MTQQTEPARRAVHPCVRGARLVGGVVDAEFVRFIPTHIRSAICAREGQRGGRRSGCVLMVMPEGMLTCCSWDMFRPLRPGS